METQTPQATKPAQPELLALEEVERIARRIVEAQQEGTITIQNTELKELGDTTIYEVSGYVKVILEPEIKGLFGQVKQNAQHARRPFTIQLLPDTGKVIGRKLG